MVHCYLVNNGLYDDVYLRAVGVVGRADMVYAVVADEVVEDATLTLLLGVIYCDRVATEVLNKLHTWNIGGTVAKVYHA